MMVEPSTHVAEDNHSLDDETMRLRPEMFQQESPPRTQVLKFDPSQGVPLDRMPERRDQTRTPEPRPRHIQRNEARKSFVSPGGKLAPFDWEEFELRYQKALQEADEHERELLGEFERLVGVRKSNSAIRKSGTFSDEAHSTSMHGLRLRPRTTMRGQSRGMLVIPFQLAPRLIRFRLQTRERYVRLSEQSMSQKKQHRK
jgi:hypothetical protein